MLAPLGDSMSRRSGRWARRSSDTPAWTANYALFGVSSPRYCAVCSTVQGRTPEEGRMDTTQLLKGVLDLAVLAVVSEEDGYGYEVLRRLRAAGLTEVGDASVYGTLRRLYAAGALT